MDLEQDRADEALEAEAPEEAYALDEGLAPGILACVEEGDAEGLRRILEPLHAADIADLIEQISPSEREGLIRLWKNVSGEVLSELDEVAREEILRYIPAKDLGKAIRELDSDDVVDFVEDLDEPRQREILCELESGDRFAVERQLTYPEGSAGRLMQQEVVWVPVHWTVGQAIDHVRSRKGLPHSFYHLMLVDERMSMAGQVALGRLMSSARGVALMDIKDGNIQEIPVGQSQEDVAYAFNQYHLVSAPVVDGSGRLVGVITIDDAMGVLGEEAEEDILRLGGVGHEHLVDSALATTAMRFPWLLANLLTAVLASAVIAVFADVIEAVVALAVLMPIIVSMGGNSGTQSLTVAVRAIATKDLTRSNFWRFLRRETLAGFLNGMAFAVIMGFVGFLWFGSPLLGAVCAVAIVFNMLVAGAFGVLIPKGLDRIGVDPALASGAFVTTVTDVTGFFAFLGLAALVLV